MIAALESVSDFGTLVALEQPAPPPAVPKDDVAGSIRKVRAGDEDAARALMERLYPLVMKLVRAYLPRRTSEEDLAQTVFMKVFARLGQYSGLVPIEHWVSRITVNTCLNQLKTEKIRPEWRWSDLSEEQQRVLESCSAAEAAPAVDRDSAAELVHRLLDMLAPKDRLVIQLLHLQERSICEIARLTGWTVPVIKVRAFRARQKLKKHLRDLEPAVSSSS